MIETYNNGKSNNIWTKANRKNRNIKDYKKTLREELLRTFNESEHFLNNLSQNGNERIAKMQNLSQNKIKQIIKMENISRNELAQIAEKGVLKNPRICQKMDY